MVTAHQLVLDTAPLGDVVATQAFDDVAALAQPPLQHPDGSGGFLTGVNIVPPAVLPYWTVDGFDPQAELFGSFEVSAKLDGGERAWVRPVIASTGSRRGGDFKPGPLGYELDHGGPPPGPRVPVTLGLDLADRDPSSPGYQIVHRLPLLTRGYSDTAGRSWSDDGHVMTLRGAGPEALWRDVKVSLKLSPGHGKTHGEMLIMLFENAGVPSRQIGIDPAFGSPRNVGITISCVPLWASAETIARPAGGQVMSERSTDIFRVVMLEVQDDEPTIMTLTMGPASDVEDSNAVGVDSDASAAACVRVSGVRLLSNETGVGSGAITDRITIESINENFVLPVAKHRQVGGGSAITPTGVSDPQAKEEVVERITIEVTKVNGCKTLTYTRVENFGVPEATRYIAATTVTGDPRLYAAQTVYFYGDAPDPDDTETAFLWSKYRFRIESETWKRPIYDDAGLRIKTITQQGGWFNPAAAIKSGNAGTDWSTRDYEGSLELNADFSGRVFPEERYFQGPDAPGETFIVLVKPSFPYTGFHGNVLNYLSETIETSTPGEKGYAASTGTAITKYGLKIGSVRLYPGNVTATSSTEIGLTATENTTYATVGGQLQAITTGKDEQGQTLQVRSVSGGKSGAPAMDQCTPEKVDTASRQKFKVMICATIPDGLGGQIPVGPGVVDLQSDLIETPSEALRYAEQELAILRDFEVSVSFASPCPVLEVGHNVILDFPEMLPGFADTPLKVWERTTVVEPADPQARVVDRLVVRVPNRA